MLGFVVKLSVDGKRDGSRASRTRLKCTPTVAIKRISNYAFGKFSLVSTNLSLLLRLRSQDDAEAWSRFVKLYTPLLFHWISKLGVESNQRNDLVQEVFMVLLGKMHELANDPPRSFRAWLRTVTLNKCRDHFRQSNRNSTQAIDEQLQLSENDSAEIFTEQEYRAYISKAALKIMKRVFSDTTWRACWELVTNGRNASDVAKELQISENAVYLASRRVLQRLREELSGLWD